MKIACGIVDVSYHNMLDIAGSQETFWRLADEKGFSSLVLPVWEQ